MAASPQVTVGLEIHQQLDTGKLFCCCPSRLSTGDAGSEPPFQRQLATTTSELGQVDSAARAQAAKQARYSYLAPAASACLVEADEEPPHQPDPVALELALKVALLLHCKVVDELHFMRKIVIDGSNTTGFQRTGLVATDGWLETPSGRVTIEQLCLEEDSARHGAGAGEFLLDRLGIPLLEITTGPDLHDPDQAREVARALGDLLRSTRRVKRGLGTIRQDLNVSVTGGARVELKGAQDLRALPAIITAEASRQADLLAAGGRVSSEVRRILADNTSAHLRPMPGAARMYPETDVLPLRLNREGLAEVAGQLPPSLEEMQTRLIEDHGLGRQIAQQLVAAELDERFAALVASGGPPAVVARTLLHTLPELVKLGLEVEALEEATLSRVLEAVGRGELAKEGVEQVLQGVLSRGLALDRALAELGGDMEGELEAFLAKLLRQQTDFVRRRGLAAKGPLMGPLMERFRGRLDGAELAQRLEEALQKFLDSEGGEAL